MNQTPTLNIKICGNGPPLIMLHGWGWHSGVWQPIIPVLSSHYELFLVDLPGFGDSPLISSQYDYATIASSIMKQVPDQANWLGWSLGGMIAWWVAIHAPEKIQRLITLASSPRFIEDHDWPGVSTKTLDHFAQALETHYEQTLTDFLDLQLRGSRLESSEIIALQQQLLHVKQPDPVALTGGLKLLRDTDFRNEIGKVQCESLHIFGSHDTLVPAEVATLIQPQLAQGHCEIIKRSGHMPFLTPHFSQYLIEALA